MFLEGIGKMLSTKLLLEEEVNHNKTLSYSTKHYHNIILSIWSLEIIRIGNNQKNMQRVTVGDYAHFKKPVISSTLSTTADLFTLEKINGQL